MTTADSPQPFEGVRVVELGGTVAAAGATKTLSDYGADAEIDTLEADRVVGYGYGAWDPAAEGASTR